MIRFAMPAARKRSHAFLPFWLERGFASVSWEVDRARAATSNEIRESANHWLAMRHGKNTSHTSHTSIECWLAKLPRHARSQHFRAGAPPCGLVFFSLKLASRCERVQAHAHCVCVAKRHDHKCISLLCAVI